MSMRIEHELLTCVASRDLDENRRERLRRLIAETIDWDYLVNLAHEHALIPLLHKHVTAIPDAPSIVQLEEAMVANAQENLYLIASLRKVLRKFREEGVRVLILKGPILSQMVYGEISLRQAGDLDLLVHRNQFERAKMLLESLGFQMTPSLTLPQQTSHLNFQCEIQFMRDEGFTVVDLHWGLAPKTFAFRLATDEVMKRSQTVKLANEVIETLGPEDMILYQCMHGTKHLWSNLECICSLSELIRTTVGIDWEELAKRSAKARCTRMLALGLRLVQRHSEVAIPDRIMSEIDGNNAMGTLADETLQNLFRPRRVSPNSTKNGLYKFKIMDRKQDAVWSMLLSVFVPTLPDWEALTLPDAAHPLYYAFRPLRLSKVYSILLWRKLTGQPQQYSRAS